MVEVINLVLLAMMVFVAIAVSRARSLFASVMLAGIFSLLSAGIFTVLDAVDVAFTEAAVGAGMTTVLFLGTLSLTTREEKVSARRSILPLLLVVLTGAVLVYGTMDLPKYGDPTAPIHHHVAPRYIKVSPDEIDVPNIVTSVLASYRGYDTLGETTVIFTAGVGVILLLRGARRKEET
jgi:multicomponent Na+:H+ antiporter subunit B